MKELVGNTGNVFLLSGSSSEVMPMVEVCLMVSEVVYTADVGSVFAKSRSLEFMRFTAQTKYIRATAKQLEALADEADALASRVTLEPESTD